MKINAKYGIVAALTMAAFVAGPAIAPFSAYAATSTTTETTLTLDSSVTYTTKFNKSAIKTTVNYSEDVAKSILDLIYIKDGSSNTWYQASKYNNIKLGVYDSDNDTWAEATSANLKGSKDGTQYKVAAFDGDATDISKMVDNNTTPTDLTAVVKKISVSGSVAVTASAAKFLTYGTTDTSEWTFKVGNVAVDGSAAEFTDDKGDSATISSSSAAGTYTVKLKLSQGDYDLGLATDDSQKEFTGKATIAAAALSADDFTVNSAEYTGSEVKNNVNSSLTEDEDYTLTFSNNAKVGTATVKIVGKGNYSGTITKNFAITPATVSALKGDTTTAMYTGSAITPAIVDNGSGGYKFTSGYTVSFESDQDHTNAGTSTFTFKGDNSNIYTATDGITGSLNIAQLNIAGADANVFTNASKAKEYSLENGIAVVINTKAYDAEPTVSAVYAYGNLVSSNLYTTKVTKTTGSADNATITFTGAASAVAAGNVVATSTVTYTTTNEKSITNATVSGIAKAYTYNGNSKEPIPTVTLNGTKLVEGTDYVVSHKNNVKVGTAKVVITGIGDYTGSITKSFYIDPAKSSVKKVSVGAKKMTVTVKKGTAASGVQIGYRVKGTSKWSYTKTTSTSKTIKSLKKGKKYQIVVRSYTTKSGKVTNYSGWSATKPTAKIK